MIFFIRSNIQRVKYSNSNIKFNPNRQIEVSKKKGRSISFPSFIPKKNHFVDGKMVQMIFLLPHIRKIKLKNK